MAIQKLNKIKKEQNGIDDLQRALAR